MYHGITRVAIAWMEGRALIITLLLIHSALLLLQQSAPTEEERILQKTVPQNVPHAPVPVPAQPSVPVSARLPSLPSENDSSTDTSLQPVAGYCAVTEGAGDCAHGSSGCWQGLANLSACAARCERCARCRFVSYSRELNDCSWYARCPLLRRARLLQRPASFTTFGVVAGRAPIAPPLPWRLRRSRSSSTQRTPRPQNATSSPSSYGYCAMTVAAGACSLGDSGELRGARSITECRERCLACPRCAVISWSQKNADCSFYAYCALDDLRRPPRAAPDYTSLRVRSAPRPVAMPAATPAQDRLFERRIAAEAVGARRSLAIATLAVPQPASAQPASASSAPWAKVAVGCALPQWCERSALLARAVRATGWRVATVLLGAADTALADCPDAAIVPIAPAVRRAMRECALAHSRGAAPGASHDLNMLKWTAISLVDYELVLYADVDIDLMPSNELIGTAARRWSELARTLESAARRKDGWQPQLVANADAMAPFNGGLWLVRPSAITFEDGLATLRACRFNSSHGWEHAGSPRALGLTPRHADGEPVTSDVGDRPLENDAYRRNDWSFVGGDVDQGFWFYMFFVRQQSGAYFRYGRAHKVLHWRAWPKPWELEPATDPISGGVGAALDLSHRSPWELSLTYTYLRSSTTSLLRGGDAAGTPCARRLWSVRRAIEEDERFFELPATRLGQTVPYFALF